jgi:hypothetical protein
MSDWIKKQAEAIRRQALDEEKKLQALLKKEQAIKEGNLPVWQKMLAAVKADVVAFNDELPDHADQHLKIQSESDDAITLCRQAKTFRVIHIARGAERIEIEEIETSEGGERKSRREGGDYDIANDGNLGVRIGGRPLIAEEFSEYALKKLF